MRRQCLDAGPMGRILDGSCFLQPWPPWARKSKQIAVCPGPRLFLSTNHAGSLRSWTRPWTFCSAPVDAHLIGFIRGCSRGRTGDDAAPSWPPPSSWGGIVRCPPPKHASPRLPCSQSASHPGYGARLDATEGKGSRAVPRGAPVSHGLPAGDSTRRPSTDHWFLGLHMHLRRPPYFAFCVPDGVKGALSWLGAVSHIFGRWDSRKRGGAVINARPPRPRLRTVGNFMMVLLTSHKVFSSGLLY